MQRGTRERPWLRGVFSLVAMLPWPLIGIAAVRTGFEHWNEAFLMFGGLTASPVAMLSLIGLPEWILLTVVVVCWVGAWFGPVLVLGRRARSRGVVLAVLAAQAGFSIAQAAMGVLMIWGKAA